MGIGLTELSNELIQEFDQRQKELDEVFSASMAKLKDDKKESREQLRADQNDHKEARNRLAQKTRELLLNCRNEVSELKKTLNEEFSAGSRELLVWVKDGRFQVKAWHDALHYTRGKRGRR